MTLPSRRAAIGQGLVLVGLPWAALFRAAPAAAQAAGGAARMSGSDLKAAIRALVGAAPIVDGGVALRLPAVAENGGQVPLAVTADSPMTAADHVTALHLLATANPTPGIASFRLTPALARAEIHTRIRLAADQAVIALAVHSTGAVRRAVAQARVVQGGCLS